MKRDTRFAYKICKNCGTEFNVFPYRTMTANFCSYKCNGQYKLKIGSRIKKCKNCGAEFRRTISQIKWRSGKNSCCSLKCFYEGRVNETKKKPIRDKYGRSATKDDVLWKQSVRERDKRTCRRCGKYEEYIHTHHVVPRSRSKKLRNDVNNGICLCNSCHAWVHNHPRLATEEGFLKRERDTMNI